MVAHHRMGTKHNISMVVHQIDDQSIYVEPVLIGEEIIEETGICFISSMCTHEITDHYTTADPVLIDEEIIEETQICFITSLCTHENSYLEAPAESSEHQVSMVAHYQQTFDNSGIEHEDVALSMVCHQTSEHYNVQECQVDEQEPELIEDEDTVQDENFTFYFIHAESSAIRYWYPIGGISDTSIHGYSCYCY